MKSSEGLLVGFAGGVLAILLLVFIVVFLLGRCITPAGVVCI